MIDSTFLDKWTSILVPEEYGPNRSLDAGKPLLCITLYTAKEMEGFKNDFYPEVGDDVTLRGHIINMGLYMEYAKFEDYEKFINRYLVKINMDLSEEAAIFALLHEVGHLHGFISESEEHNDDPDEFADNYALRQAAKLIEDPSLRLKVLLEGLDSNFRHG